MKLLQIIIPLTIFLLLGCTNTKVNETPPMTPLKAELKITNLNEPLRLGSEADITLTAFSKLKDISWPNTRVNINLPEGISLISGDTEWIGDLEFGNPITLNARIKFTEVGNWTLTAGANYSEPGTGAGIWPTVWKCFIVAEEKIAVKDYACEADYYIPPPPGMKISTEKPSYEPRPSYEPD